MPLAINGGFAYANNRALALLMADSHPPEAIALINPDARVRPGAIEAMAALLAREPRAGAVGARLEHEDGRPQASAFHFPSLRGEFCRGARTAFIEKLLGQPPSRIDADVACKVPWVTGAAVTLRAAALHAVGFFDEGFFLYFEETDLMRRLRAGGWEIWHEPAARVVHLGGVATAIRDPETGLPKMQRMPRYWYESRRRYFARVLGSALFHIKRVALRGRDTGSLRATSDLIRLGLWPTKADCSAAVLRSGAAAEGLPAWMRARP
jgi:GT2 family glycosyltransferase